MRSTVPVLVCLCVPGPSPSVFLPAMLKRSVVRPYRYARPHECRRAGNRCGRASGCESRFCPSLRGLAKQSRFPFPRSYEVIRNDMETLLIPGLLQSKTPSQRQTSMFSVPIPSPSVSRSPSVFLPAMLQHSVVRPYRYARRHECCRAGNRCGRACPHC